MASSTNPFIICFYFNRDNAFTRTREKSSKINDFNKYFGVCMHIEFDYLKSEKKLKFKKKKNSDGWKIINFWKFGHQCCE